VVPSPGQMPRGIPTLLIGLVCTAAGVPVFAQERLSHSQFETIRLSKIWLAAAGTASGQAVEIDHDAMRAARIVTAVRITERITFDGRLDEPVWMQAPPADDFLQKLPRNGAPATEKTVARFAYDEDNLYIGVVCAESEPDRILIKDLKEDFDFMSTDLVQIFIDSLHDRRTGFTFVVNAAGARRDSQVSISGGANQDWDGVWDAKVTHGEGAWFIEFMIPFKTLRFSNAASQEWGVNADTHQVSSNLRFNFTHHPLSDIYVVYNDRRDTTGGELAERALIVKVTNLFNF